MSSIVFDASLNTDKLESSIKSSNQTIKQWSDGVVKSGNQADAGLGKMTKSFKEAIKDQKELIKSIEGDVKKLQKAYDDATAGRAKQAAGGELRSAKRVLAEEQATLLGLQKEQIEVNNKESASMDGIIHKLKHSAIALFSLGAALKITKSIIASTETAQTEFEKVTTAASSAVGYFFKAIASGDWSNFSKGLDKAIRGAIEYVEVMEVITNKQNEQKIRSSQLDKEISELRDDTFDKDESNNAARKDALTKLIDKQKQKYTEEAKLAKDLYDINLKKAATDSGLAEDQIKNFISQYSSLEKLIEKGEEYNELTKLTRKAGVNAEFVSSLLKERDALGANAKEAGDYVKQISKVTPEVRKQLSDYAASAIEAEAAFGQKNRRDKMQLAEVTNNIKKEAEEKKKQAKEDAELNNRLAKQKELLNKAIEEGAEKDIKAIGRRIAALEKEIEARDRLAKKVIDAAEFEGFVPSTVPTSGLLAPKVTPKVKKPTPQKQWESTRKEMENLAVGSEKWLKDMGDAIAKNDKERIKQLTKELRLREQIVDEVANLVYSLGEASGLTDDQMGQLNTTITAFSQLASGNYVGAAMTFLSELIQLVPNKANELAGEIDHINRLLEIQQQLIETSSRTGGERELIQDKIELLESQEKAIRDQVKNLNIMTASKKDITELAESLQDKQAEIKAAQQELEDFKAGGVTQNTIADSIAQGFQEGKTSVDDFANYMNDVLLDSVLNIFKKEILGPEITELSQYISESLSDKNLTDKEKAEIDERTAQIAANNKELWDNLTGALDLGNGPNAGLSGQISRSITEDTGSELAGLFRRFADDSRVIKDYNKMGIDHLINIEVNTYNTVAELKLAVTELKAINSNTKAEFGKGSNV